MKLTYLVWAGVCGHPLTFKVHVDLAASLET